jgi:hypothetical protein
VFVGPTSPTPSRRGRGATSRTSPARHRAGQKTPFLKLVVRNVLWHWIQRVAVCYNVDFLAIAFDSCGHIQLQMIRRPYVIQPCRSLSLAKISLTKF